MCLTIVCSNFAIQIKAKSLRIGQLTVLHVHDFGFAANLGNKATFFILNDNLKVRNLLMISPLLPDVIYLHNLYSAFQLSSTCWLVSLPFFWYYLYFGERKTKKNHVFHIILHVVFSEKNH